MAFILFLLIAKTLICTTVTQSVQTNNAVQDDSTLTESVYDFSFNLLPNSIMVPNENIVISPVSAQVLLGLAYTGSDGTTAEAMATGLDLGNETQLQATQNFHDLMSSITQVNSGTMLSIANKIYIDQSYHISSAFEATAAAFYSSIESIKFQTRKIAAASINSWAANQTNNKIQNLVAPTDLSSSTKLLLVSAIYFKGLWEKPFNQYATSPSPFYTSTTSSQISSTTSSTNVNMMYTQNTFNYADNNDISASVIELPYQDPSLSMLFLLPYTLDGLAALESSLTNYSLSMITSQLQSQVVDVYIPKFTITFNIDFREALKEMGMKVMFSNSADFSGMLSDKKSLKMSSVIQKTYLEINEMGAAVPTGPIEENSAFVENSSSIPTFKAEYPFVFILKKKNIPLLIGSFHK